MKRIFYLSIFVLLSSCLSEKNADPGKPTTFVRYFNGGNNDFAKVAEETSDKGIIILGNTKINTETLSTNKIKLVKTDEYGNVVWQKVYPEDFSATAENITGNSLLQLSTGGYMVIGKNTQSNGKTKIFIQTVGADGLQTDQLTKTISIDTLVINKSISVEGQAIQLNTNGNYLVLASTSDATDNMVLAELDKTDLHVTWVKKYGAGASTLSNKIYLDGSNDVFWSGTVTRSSSDVRLVKTTQNSSNTLFDLPIGKPNFQEAGNDICRYASGFAIVGSTNEKINNNVSSVGDQDILLKIVTEDGTELLSKPIVGSTDTDNGNAITAVRGGLVILGTVKAGGQDDYYLMKYDAFGNEVWGAPRVFGNSGKNDTGASVRQLSDGSLLILGTTIFGGVNIMMLMKADSEGNIE